MAGAYPPGQEPPADDDLLNPGGGFGGGAKKAPPKLSQNRPKKPVAKAEEQPAVGAQAEESKEPVAEDAALAAKPK